MMDPTILLLLVPLALLVLPGIRIVPEAHRAVVLRLGRFYGVLGPGLHWILPGLDRVLRVELSRVLPAWQTLSEADIESRLRQLTVTGQLSTSQE